MANTLNLGNGNWATKEDSLLAYNSENGNFKPLPFDFSRDSSATVVNKAGLIETVVSGIPRIDFRDDSKGALLLEPQRTNYDSESLNFTTSFMSNSSGIQSSSLTSKIAPNGSNDSVYKITKATDNSDPYLGRSGVSFTDTKMVFSAWLWTDENQSKDVLFLVYRDGTQEVQTKNITLTTTPTRYFIEATFTTTPSNVSYRIDLDGVSSNQYIYAWGKQLEQGSYPTSYIPTQGSVVTRLADVCNQSNIPTSVINSSEGVLYAEIKKDKGSQFSLISLDKSSDSANYVYVGYLNNTTSLRAQIKVDSVTVLDENINIGDTNVFSKVAVKYKSGDYAFFINGSKVGNTSTSTDSFSNGDLDRLEFGYNLSSSFKYYGLIKNVKLHNQALTDQELINLTTI